MQPYQQASEESTKRSSKPFEVAAAIGASALTAGIGGRIMSMLSGYVPANLAVRGLSKIDPRLGKFANLAQEAGHSFNDIKSFISEKVQKGEQREIAKENRNIIQQESPELHQFLDQEIRKGRKPIEAAAIAQNDKKFSDVIKKLMKTHKTPWSGIVQSIFGVGDQALPEQSGISGQVQQQQGNPQAKDQLLQAMQALSQQLKQ